GAFEHWFQSLVEISHRLFPSAARKIRMYHVALDRSRTNDRDFDHDIIKTFRFHPRQRRHLRTALNLKYANRVCFLHHLERGRVIFWNVRKIEWPPALAAQLKGILHHRHHSQPKQIYLHDAEVFAIVLVPLRHNPARHRRIFQRHKRTQLVLTDNHSAGMLAEMTRQTVDRLIQPDESRHARMRFGQTSL